MKEEDIPDLNLFMMCAQPDLRAFSALPDGYTVRTCTPDDLPAWKAFPFDTDHPTPDQLAFMDGFFAQAYHRDMDLFFRNTLLVCDPTGLPVATCSSWPAYGKFQTIQWFKTLKSHEGRGLGRAVLSLVMQRFAPEDYPIYLHTQPGSFRAVKLYADFGFRLLRGERFGTRTNDLEQCLPWLRAFMPISHFDALEYADAPEGFVQGLVGEEGIEF